VNLEGMLAAVRTGTVARIESSSDCIVVVVGCGCGGSDEMEMSVKRNWRETFRLGC